MNIFRLSEKLSQQIPDIQSIIDLFCWWFLLLFLLMAGLTIFTSPIILPVWFYWGSLGVLTLGVGFIFFINHLVRKMTDDTVKNYLSERMIPEDVCGLDSVFGMFMFIQIITTLWLMGYLVWSISLLYPTFGFTLLALFTSAMVLFILYRAAIYVGQKIWRMNQRLESIKGDES